MPIEKRTAKAIRQSRKGPSTRSARTYRYPGGRPPSRKDERLPDKRGDVRTEGLATALAYFSIGLGLFEIAMPRRLANWVGLPRGYHHVLRAIGMREVASGIGMLTQPQSSTALWARVGGDAIDLAGLTAAFASPSSKRVNLAAACVAVGAVTAVDALCAQKLSPGSTEKDGIPVKASVLINRSPEELYRAWHDFENLPRFMSHVKSVKQGEDGRSHWIAKGPAGMKVEWDVEITGDRTNESISWRSLEDADVDHAGSIHFQHAPRGQGTHVRLEMSYRPPTGMLASTVAWLFGTDPNQTIKADLRRFKQLMETGEVVTTDGQPTGRPRQTS